MYGGKCNGWVFPPDRVGGAPTVTKTVAKVNMAKNANDLAPVSLGQWPNWGSHAQNEMVGKLIGCSISASAKYNYDGHFRQWELYRSINGIIPYFSVNAADKGSEEDRILSYHALSVGPLSKDMSTTIAPIHGIGHFQKLKLGANPIGDMPRVKLTIRGMRREKGTASRKSPYMLGDLKTLKNVIDLDSIDHHIVRCVVFLGWFSCSEWAKLFLQPTPTWERRNTRY